MSKHAEDFADRELAREYRRDIRRRGGKVSDIDVKDDLDAQIGELDDRLRKLGWDNKGEK